MRLPFRMNLQSIRLWHSFVPFYHEEYRCVKYNLNLPSSNKDRLANSDPLSPVMVLNTSFLCVPKYFITDSKTTSIASAVWFSAFIQRQICVIRSTKVNAQGSLSALECTPKQGQKSKLKVNDVPSKYLQCEQSWNNGSNADKDEWELRSRSLTTVQIQSHRLSLDADASVSHNCVFTDAARNINSFCVLDE